jgi:hypothetical protein
MREISNPDLSGCGLEEFPNVTLHPADATLAVLASDFSSKEYPLCPFDQASSSSWDTESSVEGHSRTFAINDRSLASAFPSRARQRCTKAAPIFNPLAEG